MEKMDGENAPLILRRPFIHKAQMKLEVDDNTPTIKGRGMEVCYNLFQRKNYSTRHQGRKWKSSFDPS